MDTEQVGRPTIDFFLLSMVIRWILMTTGRLQGRIERGYEFALYGESMGYQGIGRLEEEPLHQDFAEYLYKDTAQTLTGGHGNPEHANQGESDSLIVILHLADACPRLSCASSIETPHVLYTRTGNKQDRGTGICPASRIFYYIIPSQSWGVGTGTHPMYPEESRQS